MDFVSEQAVSLRISEETTDVIRKFAKSVTVKGDLIASDKYLLCDLVLSVLCEGRDVSGIHNRGKYTANPIVKCVQ